MAKEQKVSYVKGKLVIWVNELFCPGTGWVKAYRYNSHIHGIPTRANVRVVDPVTGEMIPQLDLSEDEYREMLSGGKINCPVAV